MAPAKVLHLSKGLEANTGQSHSGWCPGNTNRTESSGKPAGGQERLGMKKPEEQGLKFPNTPKLSGPSALCNLLIKVSQGAGTKAEACMCVYSSAKGWLPSPEE